MSVGMLITLEVLRQRGVLVDVELGDPQLVAVLGGDLVRIGAIILQGPHHSAQKSTTTGTSDAPISSRKVASVRWLTAFSDMWSSLVLVWIWIRFG